MAAVLHRTLTVRMTIQRVSIVHPVFTELHMEETAPASEEVYASERNKRFYFLQGPHRTDPGTDRSLTRHIWAKKDLELKNWSLRYKRK